VAIVPVASIVLVPILMVVVVVRIVVGGRCHPSLVQGVLQTTAPFEDERVVGMVVTLTAYCCLTESVFNRQLCLALPLYVVAVTSANFTALDHIHIALSLVLGITTHTF
jgi:hypothetical protein